MLGVIAHGAPCEIARAQVRHFESGGTYQAFSHVTNAFASTMTADTLQFWGWQTACGTVVDNFFSLVFANGVPGSLIRYGIYEPAWQDGFPQRPGRLLVDLGTVDANTPGVKSIAMADTRLMSGHVFIAATGDVTTFMSGTSDSGWMQWYTNLGFGTGIPSMQQEATVTGAHPPASALPAIAPITSIIGGFVPTIGLRIA